MKTIDFITDNIALVGTVLIGIATTAYLSASITPDLWSQIIMGIFGGGLPLISVRFLIKRKMRFFWLTVCLIVFSDVSMVLSLTAGQSRAVSVAVSSVGEIPPELKRLQKASDDAQATLNELMAQQSKATTGKFIGVLQDQIKMATTNLTTAQANERGWKPTESTADKRVNSHDVFMAIPTAIASGDLSRWMTLVFALLIATVYQGTVIATTQATVKHVRRSEAEKATTKRKKRRTPSVKKEPTTSPVIEHVSSEDFEPEPPSPSMTEVL